MTHDHDHGHGHDHGPSHGPCPNCGGDHAPPFSVPDFLQAVSSLFGGGQVLLVPMEPPTTWTGRPLQHGPATLLTATAVSNRADHDSRRPHHRACRTRARVSEWLDYVYCARCQRALTVDSVFWRKDTKLAEVRRQAGLEPERAKAKRQRGKRRKKYDL